MRVALITFNAGSYLVRPGDRVKKRVTRARRQERSIIPERHHIHIGFFTLINRIAVSV